MMTTMKEPSWQNTLQTFQELDTKIAHYNELLRVINWDLQTMAPVKGKALRARAVSDLSEEVFRLSLSDTLQHCLQVLTDPAVNEQLDHATRAKVREHQNFYNKRKQVPASEYKQFILLTTQASSTWQKARQNNDFSYFQKDLEQIVEMQKKFVTYYGYTDHPYDPLLDNYEPGITVQTLDKIFGELRDHTVRLLQKIQEAPNPPDESIFEQHFAKEQQKKFSLHVLAKLGYDLDAGRLDESVHPFASRFNPLDVRITTRYDEQNMRSAIFGTIHECGHALYGQGLNPEYIASILAGATSMAINESQSRFLENMIGRSEAFWTYFYDDLQQFFPQAFDNIPIAEFTRAINAVKPSLIRIEADELTYNLHIIVRYEIEKGLLSGDIQVADLPDIWNAKMQEYVGITPPDNSKGVLQDIHWSKGNFGYFPSYALGNLYAAQFYKTIVGEMPDLLEQVKQGNFANIREWLRTNIHQHGKLYTPVELIQRVTGESLNASYLISYLEDKFSRIYRL